MKKMIMFFMIIPYLFFIFSCNSHISPTVSTAVTNNNEATNNNGSISGTVYTINCDWKNVKSGAEVTAIYGGSNVTKTVTDINGNYTLSDLPPGIYDVSARIPGTDNISYVTVTVIANTDTSNIEITIPPLYYVPWQLLVEFNEGVSETQAQTIISNNNCSIIKTIIIPELLYIYVVQVPVNETPLSMASILMTYSEVKSAIPNYYLFCGAGE